MYPTPTARDYKGSYLPESLVRNDGKIRVDALPQFVDYILENKPLGGADPRAVEFIASMKDSFIEESSDG